jgi:hypothetical protein
LNGGKCGRETIRACNQVRVCPRPIAAYMGSGTYPNLKEVEGGDRRSRGRYVWPGLVLVGVRMKANRDLIVVARLAETHYCV